MATVHVWTGLQARVLRQALRKSVRAFAEHLGVAVNTISKWEKLLSNTTPRADTQAILDTALARADTAARERFEHLLAGQGIAVRRGDDSLPTMAEYETWTDDLERAVTCLSRQDFGFANTLLGRWLRRVPPRELDPKGLYLYARSLTLSADMQRLQGTLHDLIDAKRLYAEAHSMFADLGVHRRAAQIELNLGVVAEMTGHLAPAAARYEALAGDERLSKCDRVRARLWIGTALSKQGHNTSAITFMQEAARSFDDLAEPEDWAVTQQKLALAQRGTGELSQAMRYIDTAREAGPPNSPLAQVQLDTAHAHILVSDPATFNEGQETLGRAALAARKYGLDHQLRSINRIRKSEEHSQP